MRNYPDSQKQTIGRYLIGDVVRMNDGSVGVISEVSINEAQENPHYCQYSLARIKGFPLSKNAWWYEADVTNAILGVLHALDEWRKRYGKQKLITRE